MKKKNLLLAGLVTLLFVGILSFSSKTEAQVVIEIPDFEEEDICVCKQQICSHGSWLSLRRRCVVSGLMCINDGLCDL